MASNSVQASCRGPSASRFRRKGLITTTSAPQIAHFVPAHGRHARCSMHSWRASAPPHAGPTPRKDGPPRSLLVSDDEELGSLQTRAAGRRKARGERGVCQPRLARAHARNRSVDMEHIGARSTGIAIGSPLCRGWIGFCSDLMSFAFLYAPAPILYVSHSIEFMTLMRSWMPPFVTTPDTLRAPPLAAMETPEQS